MSTQTPAPWVAEMDEFYGKPPQPTGWIKNAEGDRNVVEYAGCGSHEAKWNEADFRLVLAAPDLLAALEAAIACGMVPVSSAKDGGASKHSEQVRVADQIRAVVAKATGRPQ